MTSVMAFRSPSESVQLFNPGPGIFNKPGVAAAERQVISTNGVDQYATFANPIVGDGQGEITLVSKFKEKSVPEALYILDSHNNANRPYVAKVSNSPLISSPSGLSITIDEVSASVSPLDYGKQQRIKISGDFTGLTLGRLFSKYDSTGFSSAQPLSLTYKDQSQAFTLNFDNGLGYEVIGEPGRNLWATGASVSSGSEGLWATIDTDPLTTEVGKVYSYKAVVAGLTSGEIGFAVGATAKGYSSDGTYAGVFVAAAGSSVTRTGSTQPNAGASITYEIREVPNALIWQNYSADQWATYVQQPNGDWKGKANLWADGATGDIDPNVTKFGTTLLEIGESYFYGSAPEEVRAFSGVSYDVYPNAEFLGVTGLTVTKVRSFNVVTQASFTPVFNHLIKLSDYQRNQFYIEQTEKAIAQYQARDTKPWLVDMDGVDDYIALPTTSPTGDFDYPFEFTITGVDYQRIIETDDGLSRVMLNGEAGTMTARISGDSTAFSVASLIAANDGSVHIGNLSRRGDDYLLSVDGVPGNTVTVTGVVWSVSLAGIDTTLLSNRLRGRLLGLGCIDHTAPLPIGQGGNSGFWPMNKNSDIVDQILGLDNKGNIIAKNGSALGSETIPVDFSNPTSKHPNLTIDYTDGVLTLTDNVGGSPYPSIVFNGLVEDGAVYLCAVTIDSTQSSKRGFLGVGNFDDTAKERALGADGAVRTVTGLLYPLGGDKLGFYLDGNPTTAGDTVKFSNMSVRKVTGYGEWQGAPVREQYALDKPSGTLLGGDLFSSYALKGANPWIDNGDGSFTKVSGAGFGQIYFDDLPIGWYELELEIVSQSESVSVITRDEGEAFSTKHGLDAIGFHKVRVYVGGSTSSSLWIDGASPTTDAVIRNLTLKKILSLSPELQRQHDLAIVESKVAKLDRQYSRAMPLQHFDGLDDDISVSWTAAGAFKVIIPVFAANSVPDTGFRLLGSVDGDSFLKLFDSDAVGNEDVLTAKISGTKQSTTLTINRGRINWLMLERDDLGYVRAGINSIIYPWSTTPITGDFVIDRFCVSNNVQRFEGKLGPALLLDYTSPLNSQYLKPTAAGWVDMIGDGSTDGFYSGNPSPPETFYKSGDNWVNADQSILIPGA